MSSLNPIVIRKATHAEKETVQNLMMYYLYDFTEYLPEMDVDRQGLFSYDHLEDFWSSKDKHAFVVLSDGKYAGFVLVSFNQNRQHPQGYYYMHEFFIMRKYRRQGLGSQVAVHMFDSFHGLWHVSEIRKNTPAQGFWRKVIQKYTDGSYEEEYTERTVVQIFRSGK